MTPAELAAFLGRIIDGKLTKSVFMWGPPGVGKSTLVQQVADLRGLTRIDVRLSQLAPTDLRD